jgi:hypothetical protein
MAASERTVMAFGMPENELSRRYKAELLKSYPT